MNPYPRPGFPPVVSSASPPPTSVSPIRRALFVDRDGTMNPDLHYLKEARRLELCRGVGDALSLARDHGYLVVCVTNQSGIERGFYTAQDVEQIHARLNELLAPHRAHVDAFYFCPHTPEHGCDCRKPRTGLFEQARRDWNIDFGSSAVLGDRALDIEAGRTLGLLTALVLPRGHEEEVRAEVRDPSLRSDILADSFAAAVGRILARG
jgi:D-glycero-D-manno-heptose 1,7-bisphosphate phosphatase